MRTAVTATIIATAITIGGCSDNSASDRIESLARSKIAAEARDRCGGEVENLVIERITPNDLTSLEFEIRTTGAAMFTYRYSCDGLPESGVAAIDKAGKFHPFPR